MFVKFERETKGELPENRWKKTKCWLCKGHGGGGGEKRKGNITILPLG